MVHMNKAYLRLLCATAFAAAAIPALAAPAAATPADLDAYRACLKQLRGDAIKSGVQAATYDAQTASLAPDMDVLGFLDVQPEFKTPIWDYMAGLVDEERIEDGRQALARHADVLARAQAEYGVDPATVVAVWGVESNFGKNLGGRPLLTSLSTLSCFGRRQSYFRGEFFATLKIIQDEHMQPERLAGSWAGAFGQTQFMPSTYLRLAVDFDGDGRRDLVDSVPDALGSTANFLRRAGWQTGQPWGFEVKLPAGMDLAGTGRRNKQPMSAWQARGIKRVDGGALPAGDTPAALLAPAGAQGPVFLVLRNFDALYSYNAAESYALAIAHLSDRLRGDLPFARAWPTDDPGLSRAERRELQELLLARGFDIGKPDGVIGVRTRQALQTVQGQLGLPADGRAGQKTLKALRTP
ncbi:peptidoglycan-binding protein [Bordetella pertussis]|uniref:Peptidoglycan-binding protein n=38 Tax=Bordetella pertussis TaxID=520 RepID=Q7VXK9_BORPE|nr:lytic murein transglycosylase [Bordetella pertussis]ETH39685.1 lytic murein transglycosylase [Bordetella pertussis H918]ETH44786.1 lytic murein transglycosylase [Bordetella pertussis H939]ETH48357.1 lytic murein transglycosylase [Bordetella pertussis H921]ETH71422.1 lytic murein transglycosylase [Bordetella pertussis STO1-CHLA-0011]ETH81123.1 lytic murein transglycosylase [Bordetella pertussis STO1-CHOC-0017]ETH87543.1 lytic murein transglycosylase [Bordetella pertussis STO1-CHOC-0018]ETH